MDENEQDDIQTGDVYSVYEDKCKQCGLHPLTQRRISDLLSELDMMGVINAKIISLGRYGRTREIKLNVSNRVRKKIKQLLPKLDRGDGVCKYLNNENLCEIYENRPLICNINELYNKHFSHVATRQEFFDFTQYFCNLLKQGE